jgi:hypothetical protein
MTKQEIITNLAMTRGGMSKEKRKILLNYFPEASASFLQQSNLIYHILLMIYILPNCSVFRIYEAGNINSSILLRVLVKFNLLTCDKSTIKHKYNITPLTRCILNDLIAAYKHNLNQFYHLNNIDKKADYLQIKQKIKTLKQK